MRIHKYLFVAVFVWLTSFANAQELSREQIRERLQTEGCVTLAEKKVKLCKADYLSDANSIEAVSIRPLAEGRYPGIVLTSEFMTLATAFAQQGFACLSVEQPGFGKSQGKRDFVGPNTIRALIAGFKKFRREPYVDSKKMGIFGYSRGAMAASLMTVRLGNDVKAAVFGAGAYDFQKAYDELKIEGIRKNMEAETGMTEKAIKERSSILQMNKLKSPVLILHSEKDENVPVSQAYLLRDRLTELKKSFEIKISPTGRHGYIDGDFVSTVLDFFSRKLKGASEDRESP
ncbi:MAG: prolyl oligopeptidase family serine peptidase [Acidobacteria bacterium]|nr:prolyl oligopeptidase family serine peptidase [Acidobacteriota bacterium]